MKKILFKGCGTAIVTPFTENGINFSEFKKLLEFQIKEGVNAIIVCGTTGESSTMTLEEKKTNNQICSRYCKKKNSCNCWNWW